MEIVGEWEDSLIWCPSQCELEVEHEGAKYILYLRWRWSDPWAGSIIIKDKERFIEGTWGVMLLNCYKDSELEYAKKEIIETARYYFNDITKEELNTRITMIYRQCLNKRIVKLLK